MDHKISHYFFFLIEMNGKTAKDFGNLKLIKI